MVSDPVADFLNQIKNASLIGKREVEVPYSTMKHSIAEILRDRGYVTDVQKKGKKERKILAVTLPEGKMSIRVQRVSKPSRRLYVKAREVYSVRGGRGLTIVSTPKGVMSGEDARKENVGGEILCKIW
jgi:small subunit ribosomal protein S8